MTALRHELDSLLQLDIRKLDVPDLTSQVGTLTAELSTLSKLLRSLDLDLSTPKPGVAGRRPERDPAQDPSDAVADNPPPRRSTRCHRSTTLLAPAQMSARG